MYWEKVCINWSVGMQKHTWYYTRHIYLSSFTNNRQILKIKQAGKQRASRRRPHFLFFCSEEEKKMSEQTNSVVVTEEEKEEGTNNKETSLRLLQIEGASTCSTQNKDVEETLYRIIERMITAIFSPDANMEGMSLFLRIKKSIYENVPLIPEASTNSTRNLLNWTRQGSSLRALLVISIGTIVLLALSGLLVFMVFFVAATVNAIIISLLISVAAAGGFLAIFFTCMTAIYIGALSVAVFVISSATITTIFAVLIATGWIGFFWTVWIVTKKGMSLAKHSLSITGSALSAYSATRQASQDEPRKE